MSSLQGNIICSIFLLAMGSYFVSKINDDKNDMKEYFGEQYKATFPDVQYTSTGAPFLNVGSGQTHNTVRKKPFTDNLSQTSSNDEFSRVSSYPTNYRQHSSTGLTRNIRGRANNTDDGPTTGTYSSIDAMRLANLASDVPVSAVTKIYVDPLKYSDHLDTMIRPKISDMTMGKDPSDPKNFIVERVMIAPLKSRLSMGGDPLRGDLPILPNTNGWFDRHVDTSQIKKGYFDSYNNDLYDHSGHSIKTKIDGRDTITTSARASGLDKRIPSPSGITYQRLTA
jgi:hypothetical protein